MSVVGSVCEQSGGRQPTVHTDGDGPLPQAYLMLLSTVGTENKRFSLCVVTAYLRVI